MEQIKDPEEDMVEDPEQAVDSEEEEAQEVISCK